MTTTALRSVLPTPDDVFGVPAASRFEWEGDVAIQAALDHENVLEGLVEEEKLLAYLRSPMAIPAARTVTERQVFADKPWPAWLVLALATVGAAIYTSERMMAKRLDPSRRDKMDLYADIRQAVQESHGVELPERAPSLDDLRKIRSEIAANHLVNAMIEDFTEASRTLLPALGSLQYRKRSDLCDPSLLNVLVGDGTFTRMFSDKVTGRLLSDGEWHVAGSTAATPSRQRVQTEMTNGKPDGKGNLHGINIAHVGTLTRFGYLLLGFDFVPGAEGPVALDLIESLCQRLPRGAVEAVIYDRALDNWNADYLLSRYAIPLATKASASNEPEGRAPEHVRQTRAAAQKVTERSRDRYAAALSVRPAALTKAERFEADAQALRELFAEDATFEPGLFVRRSSRNVPELVHSEHYPLGQAVHQRPDGSPCAHQLVVDNDALSVLDEAGHIVARPVTFGARAVEGPAGYEITASWTIPCSAAGDFTHSETWTPRPRRGPDSDSDRQARDSHRDGARLRALANLRLIPETDPRAAVILGQRNVAESWHATYKQTLTNRRARGYYLDQQLLHYLGAALAYNATVWYRYSMYQRQHCGRLTGGRAA